MLCLLPSLFLPETGKAGDKWRFPSCLCSEQEAVEGALALPESKRCVCASSASSSFPLFLPLLFNVSNQASLLRPGLCVESKASVVKDHFKPAPSSAWRGEAGVCGSASRGCVRQSQAERARGCCSSSALGRHAVSSGGRQKESCCSLASGLGQKGCPGTPWSGSSDLGLRSPLVVLSSYCCSVLGRCSTVFYGLCLTRLGAGCLSNQPGACPSVSSCWAQRWCAPCAAYLVGELGRPQCSP